MSEKLFQALIGLLGIFVCVTTWLVLLVRAGKPLNFTIKGFGVNFSFDTTGRCPSCGTNLKEVPAHEGA